MLYVTQQKLIDLFVLSSEFKIHEKIPWNLILRIIHYTHYIFLYNNWNFIPFAKRCWRFQIALGNTKIPPHKFWKKEWKMSSILFLIPNVSDILAFCSRKWYRWTPKFSAEYYLSEKYLALEFFARTYLTPQPKNISIKGKYYCIMHISSKNIAKSFSGMVTWQSKNKSEEMAPRKPPPCI